MTTVRALETGWTQQTPVDDSILRRFLFNQADLQDRLARAVHGRTHRCSEIALTDTGAPTPYLNQAVLLRPLSPEDDPVLEEVSAFYRNHGPGLLLSVWPTGDLSHRGWRLGGHPMFVARGAQPVSPTAGLRPGVSVRVADTAEDIALVERIVIDGYPIPQLSGAPPHSAFGAALAGGDVRYRIGYLDDMPVAVAASHVGQGVVNLCLAATLPEARRRGVWQALLNARCDDAPDLPAVAFTSDYSRPGFVRLGFLPVMRFTLWVIPS
ncbi:MAG TPA: hypothetical protein VHE57_02065 [Mycobacteriales bacterium]|nr:hypothetical protein [Mycobacteriales bacterium]